MFSLSPQGHIQTGAPGYAFILSGGYLFLRDFTAGAQSSVQLVANLGTHEVVIRKAREVRILAHLHSLPRAGGLSLTPRWTTCISHETVLPPPPPGPPRRRPPQTLRCTRVSYWRLCNGGTLGEWLLRSALPPSMVARCLAQVCETLRVMYHGHHHHHHDAGHEAVYHCDLHLGNVLLHFAVAPGGDGGPSLPDFYIGDFGCARTAGEALLDTQVAYRRSHSSGGDASRQARRAWEAAAYPGEVFPSSSSPPPGVARPGQRRRWDLARLRQGLESFLGRGPESQHAGLRRLMAMVGVLDEQDRRLAAVDPESRPPELLELVREAKAWEVVALAAERDTEAFRAFLAQGRTRAQAFSAEMPLVFGAEPGNVSTEALRAAAEEFAGENIEGAWSLIPSV